MRKYIKAFIAGLVLPSVLTPIILEIAIKSGRPQALSLFFIHLLPIIWGIWNMLYFLVFKSFSHNRGARLMLTGAVLGFGLAVYGVFGLDVPTLLALPAYMHYVPLVAAPIVYALLWRWGVGPINNLLEIADT